MTLHNVDKPLIRRPRPIWVLWFIALPVAVLLGGILHDPFGNVWHTLTRQALTLVGAPLDPSEVQKVMNKIVVQAAMPWLVVSALFRLIRLDVWLAPNLVSMALFGVFNGLFVGQWVYRVYMASTGGIPFVRGWMGHVFPYLLLFSVLGGLFVLMLSTAWHRGAVERWMGIDRFRRLWIEI